MYRLLRNFNNAMSVVTRMGTGSRWYGGKTRHETWWQKVKVGAFEESGIAAEASVSQVRYLRLIILYVYPLTASSHTDTKRTIYRRDTSRHDVGCCLPSRLSLSLFLSLSGSGVSTVTSIAGVWLFTSPASWTESAAHCWTLAVEEAKQLSY